MRLPWQKRDAGQQLDLLSDAPASEEPAPASPKRLKASPQPQAVGFPRMVRTSQIDEDPANPRTEFPEDKVSELAEDVRLRGILEPLVVHAAGESGRYLLHFGAMRLRAAVRAGLLEVPVIIRDAPADRYAQVAENLKRHNLSPLDLARFIRGQMDAGESQTMIARQLGMNLTTVAHHLSLLDLPPVLDDALRAGRCTSPRTLHELSALHDRHPERVADLLDGSAPVTREAVRTLRARVDSTSVADPARLISQAMVACDRLERLLAGINTRGTAGDHGASQALRARVAALSRWTVRGSDGQTP